MKIRMIGSVVVLSLGLAVSAALACPKESAGDDQKKQTVSAKATEPCGAAKAITVAAKLGTDGRSEKSETVTAVKSKPGCSKPCGGAKTVAASETPKAPCHGKSTLASETPKAPCHGKTVQTASDKSGGCGKGCKCGGSAKGAKLTSAKSTGEPGVVPCPLTGKPIKPGDCPLTKKVNAVLTSMPSMTYRVGSEMIHCSKSAASLAEKSGKTIEFMIGDEVFSDQGEATVKLAMALEKQAESLKLMQFVAGGKSFQCPVTAKKAAKGSEKAVMYRVGGFDFAKKDDADKALKSIDAAVTAITMTYKVDGKAYGCSKTAGAKCKASGKKLTYVVGNFETCCEQTAKLKFAEMIVKRIIEAAAETFGSAPSDS